ncbi:MAG TPA: hypothetical protein DC020_07525 [Flavobacterium sp.]|nr:hypothetical protein [Flavobacterium sp.]
MIKILIIDNRIEVLINSLKYLCFRNTNVKKKGKKRTSILLNFKFSIMKPNLDNDSDYIFRKCITTRDGRRICKTDGSCFRIPIKKNK